MELSSILILPASCQHTCVTYHCCVYSEETPDDGQRNCPKHVEFYSKNKFEKIVHLVGFNTLRTGSFKLFKRPLPGFFLTILTL